MKSEPAGKEQYFILAERNDNQLLDLASLRYASLFHVMRKEHEMKYAEFIEFLDEIIDYDDIVSEYGLSYSEIKFAIDHMKEKLGNAELVMKAQPEDSADRFDPVCRKCGDPLTTEELICDDCRNG